jgi:hypothetical protein
MGFVTPARLAARLLPPTPKQMTAGGRERPERIVLGVRDGVDPSAKLPVRLFVGTEPGQFRAERVFIWSIEQVRDPARIYEIHLMKDLAGFDRRRWLTGFTNYRFVIPHLCNNTGRAIYNDVDQIYLADPAELFDTAMGEHGFLAINGKDTSVMLIDCERMGAVWTMESARHDRRKPIEARARAANLWGPLDPAWNARDWEYEKGRSKVLHFTTIHTQPWQPFPRRFVYLWNPVGYVWRDLEKSADQAGFQVFSVTQPSERYKALLRRLATATGAGVAPLTIDRPPKVGEVRELDALLAEWNAASVLDYGLAGNYLGARPQGAVSTSRTVLRRNPLAGLPAEQSDAVVCTNWLEYLPLEDIPWVIDALFRSVRRLVYAEVPGFARTQTLPDGTQLDGQVQDASWWSELFRSTGARYRHVHWRLVIRSRTVTGREQDYIREGGRLAASPSVWVLGDDKAGHTTQSVGLADALGWPYSVKPLYFRGLNRISNRLLGASRLGVDVVRSAVLAPPWPDVVISTGRRTAPVARWISKQSRGRTRLVQLGRKGGDMADSFDVSITCEHFRLPVHPRRLETVIPLHAVTAERLDHARKRWPALFGDAPHPWVVLVVGGTSAMHELNAETARRMGDEVRAFADQAGGTLFAITSPRTGEAATRALCEGLRASDRVHVWKKGEAENPYLAYLAHADVLVVTGESESMLAEATAVGKPLYIYPLPERERGPRLRFSEWVASEAHRRRVKDKGTIRPQQGREYFCARLIERGFVRPPRDLNQLHEGLVRIGAARMFGEPFDKQPPRPLRETEDVAQRVRELLGFYESPTGEATAPDGRQESQASRGVR